MSRRGSCKRGMHFKDYIFEVLVKLSEELGLSVSSIVNEACEWWLTEKLTGEVKEQFMAEAEVRNLIDEEKTLWERQNAILRSRIHMEDYMDKLLHGDPEHINLLKRGKAVYHRLEPEERDAILRIFERREQISRKLVELTNKHLPPHHYQIIITDKGTCITKTSNH